MKTLGFAVLLSRFNFFKYGYEQIANEAIIPILTNTSTYEQQFSQEFDNLLRRADIYLDCQIHYKFRYVSL